MIFKIIFKKYFLIPIFVSIFFVNTAFAQETPATNVSESEKSTEVVSLDIAKKRIGNFLQLLENTRLYYAEYFKKIRDKNKEAFSTLEVVDLDQQPTETDVAGVQSGTKMPSTDDLRKNFAEYAMYFLASSLNSFFANKAIFYTGLILFVFLSLRFILRRFL